MIALPDLPCFYDAELNKSKSTNRLPDEECHHVINVLRLDVGNSILVSNGRGHIVKAEITEVNKRYVEYLVLSPLVDEPQSPYEFELIMSLLKSKDRIEWLIEKCVEVGIGSIKLVKTDRSTRNKPNSERWLKNAVSALKQSRKAWLPSIEYFDQWENALNSCTSDQKMIAWCETPAKQHLKKLVKHKRLALAVGPEGDFTPDELASAEKHGFVQCSLGAERLRGETAGIFGLICYHSVLR